MCVIGVDLGFAHTVLIVVVDLSVVSVRLVTWRRRVENFGFIW